MAKSIELLKKEVDIGWGPTMASQFEVHISLPSQLYASGDEGYTSASVSILCQSVSLPGQQLATTDLSVYGPPIKMPYGLVNQDLVLTFLCTNSMAQRKVFEKWRRIIVDPTTNYVNYYDTFVGEVIVQKLSPMGVATYTCLFEEAFPVSILEQELGSGNNDWLRLTVVMSYRRWRSKDDLNAAYRAGFTAERSLPEGIPTPPGEIKYANPNDIFKNTIVPKVPEFKP